MELQELTMQEMEQVNGGGLLGGSLLKGLLGKCSSIVKVDADIDLDLDVDIDIC